MDWPAILEIIEGLKNKKADPETEPALNYALNQETNF
jgi:hypothetical protein